MYESHDRVAREREGDFIEFAHAGAPVKGEFECTSCGYAVTVSRKLPRCPICRESLWERSLWSPFSSTLAGLRSRLS